MIEAVELTIRQPGQPDRVVRLQEGAVRLGRAEDNEIVLPDVGVSRRHAQIYVGRGEVTVEDLGSGNGTYYNGYRIQSQPIQSGDEVVIDPFVLQFRVLGQERAAQMHAADQAPARLEVVVGTGMAGSSYPITQRGLSIGRSEDRDVVIPDPASSRHHCQITLMGDDYVLRDMGSANGVYVNAVRVRDCTLADGDLIRIGNTEMRFVRYDQQVSDTTTQVVPHEVWNAGAGEPAFHPPATILPREAPRAARSGGSNTGIIGLAVGMVVTVLAFLGVVLLGAILVLLYFSLDERLPTIPASPPAWKLQLPPGLSSATANDLFDAGVGRMREGDRRGALQDFYRVLEADPGNSSAEKFAFAAGELLVLDALQGRMEQQVADKRKLEAERDRLLRDARRAGRIGRVAVAALEQRFRDDPVVIAERNWKKTDKMLALEQKARDAADLLNELKYAEAAKLYLDVLKGSNDPTLRKTAAAGLKMSQREVARAHAPQWTRAVMTEALGDRADAHRQFRDLAAEDPTNASYRLHLQRLGK